MKLLFFSCLVALALAMPDALHLSADNENVIPLSEVSSSEESFHQLNRDRYPLEEYELDKSREDLKTSSSEESVTPSTEERVRREVGYTFIKEGSSASRERKKDVNGRRLQDLRKLLQERAIHLRYLESLYHPIELIKPQEYRELFMEIGHPRNKSSRNSTTHMFQFPCHGFPLIQKKPLSLLSAVPHDLLSKGLLKQTLPILKRRRIKKSFPDLPLS
ncbi:alpha-S1-casein isoform X3 [Phascolarctos cinereus]|uniref:Alpha-S1-casein-like isoform X3 n=1 Tax=Phascolarctos cinereus TaxID=38626 RepID=A0A6P5KF56_PHACI|nr:alpha-S1-casein-like isoform X3 [Phascolarctos cinereus]